MKKMFACLAALLVAAAIANAADGIALANSEVYASPGNESSSTIAGFDIGSGNALVVAISLEGSSAIDVTFGDATLTLGVESAEGNQRTLIYYLLDASGVGDIVASPSAEEALAISALSLSDVGDVGDSNTGNNTDASDITLTYAADAGDFAVIASVENGFSSATPPDISGDNSPVLLQQKGTEEWGTTTDGGFSHWYASIASSGDFSNTIDITMDNSSRNSASVLTFGYKPSTQATLKLIGITTAQ